MCLFYNENFRFIQVTRVVEVKSVRLRRTGHVSIDNGDVYQILVVKPF